MNVDIDTRKLDLKEGDMLIFDGKQMTVVTKEELLKPITEELDEIKDQVRTYLARQDIYDKKIGKIDKFVQTLRGFNK
jgi:hypothetical protein